MNDPQSTPVLFANEPQWAEATVHDARALAQGFVERDERRHSGT